ncbi:MAG: hypothetical protein M3Z32_13685, partial [Acidobacteriota bacterium]|nr:hypothetical protein [Acidobacteriota bacterium]
TALLSVIGMAAALAAVADVPRLEYSKFFKGSVPEFVSITVEKSGQVTYKEAADDERPIRFQMPPEQVAELFALAGKLDHFTRPLESPLKVAHMGIKTFRIEDGPTKGEVKFNYSADPDARELADRFERITETEQNFINLERTVKFDKLGVNQALLLLQITYEKKRLIAPEQFLPLLDRVSKNESYMHMSRERAASLADLFRNPPAETEIKK